MNTDILKAIECIRSHFPGKSFEEIADRIEQLLQMIDSIKQALENS
jgi:hypothetical protein